MMHQRAYLLSLEIDDRVPVEAGNGVTLTAGKELTPQHPVPEKSSPHAVHITLQKS